MHYISHGVGGGPEILVSAQTDQPVAKPGEVLIKVAFAGVNRPDCAQRSGRYPPPKGASPIKGGRGGSSKGARLASLVARTMGSLAFRSTAAHAHGVRACLCPL